MMRNIQRMASLLATLLAPGLIVANPVPITGPIAERLPRVISAHVPFYPPVLQRAHYEGEVRLIVTTDGERVSKVSVESGQPMLAAAAEQNVRTWEFESHTGVTFKVRFQYRIVPEPQCFADSGTVSLRLPTEVEITVKSVWTCDPFESKVPPDKPRGL
jgi:TonB-like protein